MRTRMKIVQIGLSIFSVLMICVIVWALGSSLVQVINDADEDEEEVQLIAPVYCDGSTCTQGYGEITIS